MAKISEPVPEAVIGSSSEEFSKRIDTDPHVDPQASYVAPFPPFEEGSFEASRQWWVAECLKVLKRQIDAVYPGRNVSNDGTIVTWHVPVRPGKLKALDKNKPIDALINKIEKLKAGMRAKEEPPFRVVKHQFGFVKVRSRGLKKKTAQFVTLFALSNLWLMRGKMMETGA